MLVENNSSTKKNQFEAISIFEAADVGISIVNRDGYFVDVNDAFCALHECSKEEITDKHFTTMLPLNAVEDAKKAHENFFKNGKIEKGEYELIKSTGERFQAKITAKLIYDKKGVPYKASTIFNISEKKYSEVLQSVLLEISQEAGFIESLNELFAHIHVLIGKLMSVDNFYIAIYDMVNGIISFPYIVDREEPDITELELDINKNKSITTHIIEKEEAVLFTENDILDLIASGEIVQIGGLPKIYLGAPLKFREKTIGVIALQSYHDDNVYTEKHKKILEIIANQIARVIERKNFEQELIVAKRKAEESNRIKSEFLAQMSHEIRTPINSILSFSSLIRNDLECVVSGELKECFDLIERGGKRLIRTIDLILNVAQLQMGKYKVDLIDIDLADDILSPLIVQFGKIAAQKGITLTLTNKIDYTRIVCDYYSVNQMFINLIDNAIKYTPRGKVEIIVKKNDNGNLVVDIIDTGIGISKEFLHEVFEIFTQEETGYTRKFEGTGLGLSLVKQYAELNNARVTVTSEKGKGSKFSVIFN
ncbi:MAG: ATP-binding protein [Ignavibacteria bacterium]|jgi:PAS domain S-box-containing protein